MSRNPLLQSVTSLVQALRSRASILPVSTLTSTLETLERDYRELRESGQCLQAVLGKYEEGIAILMDELERRANGEPENEQRAKWF